MRAATALFLCLITGFGLSFLLALGERDWFHCFAYADGIRPPMPSLLGPGELMPVLLETLTPPFGDPYLFLLHFAPGLVFATYWLGRPRRPLLIAYLLFVALAFVLLLPISGQHDCDRKGTEGLFTLFLLAPVGTLLAMSAAYLPQWIKPRHDPKT